MLQPCSSAFSSKTRCFRVSKTERYCLTCFEITRKVTKTRSGQAVFDRADEQAICQLVDEDPTGRALTVGILQLLV
jgi:hypothetical protein